MIDAAMLSDIEEIKQLKSRYFYHLDHKDWDGWRENVFCCDASMHVPEAQLELFGLDNILACLKTLLADVVTVHHGHMPLIQILSPDDGKRDLGDGRLADLAQRTPSGRRCGTGPWIWPLSRNLRARSGRLADQDASPEPALRSGAAAGPYVMTHPVDSSAVLGRLFGLDGRVAAVTGAAEGMGHEIAKLLAAAGASVAILDRNSGGAVEVARAIEHRGGRAAAIGMDLADEQSIVAAIRQVAQQFGGIDILVNCAGIQNRELLTETSTDYGISCIASTAADCSSACARRRRSCAPPVAAGGSSTSRPWVQSIRSCRALPRTTHRKRPLMR